MNASSLLRLSVLTRLGLALLLPGLPPALLQAADAPAAYLAAGLPDSRQVLPPPPLPDSPEQAADMTAVANVARAASSNEVAAAFAEKKFSAFNFTPAIGAYFTAEKLPLTAGFLARVQHEAAVATDAAKLLWHRPRPFVLDPSLATGKLEASFSYPSGHSTEGYVVALVLADLVPDRRDAILAIGRSLGWHRVQIARHYPSDIHAGRIYGLAIYRELRASEAYRRDFAQATAELAAAGKP